MKRVKFVPSMWSICGGGGGMVERLRDERSNKSRDHVAESSP